MKTMQNTDFQVGSYMHMYFDNFPITLSCMIEQIYKNCITCTMAIGNIVLGRYFYADASYFAPVIVLLILIGLLINLIKSKEIIEYYILFYLLIIIFYTHLSNHLIATRLLIPITPFLLISVAFVEIRILML